MLPARGVINDTDKDTFVDTSQTLHNEAEREGEEGQVVAALLQRNNVPATHTVQVVVAPFYSPAFATTT